ncbi:MAG TPA: ABC transporter permease [Dehalococcoidia bacterium]|nr:ABC transporter permease [Dehalococcoidia bacterium]
MAENSSEVIIRRKRRFILIDLVIRLFKEKPLGFVGFIIIILLALTAVFADLTWLGFPPPEEGGPGLASYGWNQIMLEDRLTPPSSQFLLGTDNLGRDILSRIVYGSRISIVVALGAQAISVIVKLLLAVPSGYFGGKFDLILQRFIDAWMCFPPLALYLTIMAVLGAGIWQVIVVLGVSGGISQVRVIRSAVIRIREDVYFEAARAIGVPGRQIILRHVIPNIVSIVIISVATGMGMVILAESTLSFLGLGIPPPYPSWGGMLSTSGRQHMLIAPWMMVWPGVALSLVVFSFNMLADALRDLLDPRLRGGLGRYGMSLEQLQKLAEKKSLEMQR